VSAALERCLGPQAEEASILAAETGKKTLTEAVAVLSAKTALLEPKNLDLFEGEKAIVTNNCFFFILLSCKCTFQK
jgi:hypothetical protein